MYRYKCGYQVPGSRVESGLLSERPHPLKSRSKIQCPSWPSPDRFWIDFGCPIGPQIETQRRSRRAFWCMSVTDGEKEGFCKLSSCIINNAKMQSACENRHVFKDFAFVAVVGIAYHLSSRGLKKTLKNWCPRRPKTSPKRFSMSYASWKRFWNGFGMILDS